MVLASQWMKEERQRMDEERQRMKEEQLRVREEGLRVQEERLQVREERLRVQEERQRLNEEFKERLESMGIPHITDSSGRVVVDEEALQRLKDEAEQYRIYRATIEGPGK